jgi:hypothetical protein
MAQFAITTSFRPEIGVGEIPIYHHGRIVAAGFQTHIAKPVDTIELASEILRILEQSSSAHLKKAGAEATRPIPKVSEPTTPHR